MRIVSRLSFVLIAFLAGMVSSPAFGAAAPSLLSVTPANGATGVPTTTSLVFKFDQDMDTDVPLFPTPPGSGIAGTFEVTAPGFDGTSLSGVWTDARTATISPSSQFPNDATFTWKLNPTSGTPFLRLQSAEGVELPTITGTFSTGTGGTNEPCDGGALPTGFGQYSLSKSFNYVQTSAADPVEDTNESSFIFTAFVSSAAGAGTLTGASFTEPDQTVHQLNNLAGLGQYLESADNAAALDVAFPAGAYVLNFTNSGAGPRQINMTMPASSGHAVPKIANFAAAQTINPASAFTLQWNAFSIPAPNGFISMYIADTNSHVVFQAPNPCEQRELNPTDTSIVIPAGTLQSNKTYTASIIFGNNFYYSTNAVPQMYGFGSTIRNTSFTVKTVGGGVVGAAAELVEERLLTNGNPQFKINGTPNAVYYIERATSLTLRNFGEIGTVTIPAGGQITYEDTTTPKSLPLYYRVVAR